MLIVALFCLLHPTTILAQLKTVNESCEATPCEQGLNCVDTKEGKKCAACDQSKLSGPDYQNAPVADGRVLVDV